MASGVFGELFMDFGVPEAGTQIGWARQLFDDVPKEQWVRAYQAVKARSAPQTTPSRAKGIALLMQDGGVHAVRSEDGCSNGDHPIERIITTVLDSGSNSSNTGLVRAISIVSEGVVQHCQPCRQKVRGHSLNENPLLVFMDTDGGMRGLTTLFLISKATQIARSDTLWLDQDFAKVFHQIERRKQIFSGMG